MRHEHPGRVHAEARAGPASWLSARYGSEIAHDFEQHTPRLWQAPEIGASAPRVDQNQTADGPPIRKVVVGAQLQACRPIGEVGIDEAANLELRHEGIDPVHPQKREAATDQLLLVGRIFPDVPERARNRRQRARLEAEFVAAMIRWPAWSLDFDSVGAV
jgi:hypothetical protein